MLNKLFLILIFSVLSFSVIVSQQTANQFRRLNNENGLSNNQINTIFSDSKGVIWFATVSGLNRYDGYSFRVFKNIPGDTTSLPENSIQRIYEDHLGYLWLFTNNAFYIFDPLTETFRTDHKLFKDHDSLPNTNINSLRIDISGNLWISNNQSGVYHYNVKTGELHHLHHQTEKSDAISSNRIMDVVFCCKGLAYIVNASGVIDVVDPKSLKVIERLDYVKSIDPGSDQSLRLFIDSDDDFWIYSLRSSDGLFYINRTSGKVKFLNSTSKPLSLSSNLISGILEDNSGKIWISTDHGGINVIDKHNMTNEVLVNVPGDGTSLSSNAITSLYKSHDNIIWVGTYKNGINYYHEQLYQFNLYRSQPFLQSLYFSNDVNCFAEDLKGNLWIGTNGNGLVYYDRYNNTYKTFRHQNGNSNSLSNDIMVYLCVDHKNRLWIGTYHGGLNCYDGKQFKQYKNDPQNPTSLSDDRIWQIYEDKSNRLWIGTLGGGLELYDENTDSFIHHREGDYNSVNSNYILAISEDKQDNLLVGTSAGFNILNAKTRRFRQYFYEEKNPKGLSHPSVLCILEDARGRLWVGTRNGLNLFDRETNTFRVFREEHGLPDNNIITMLDGGSGDVWIATLNGLSNLKTNEKEQVFQFKNYDVLDGLQGREFNEHSALKTSKGELIFGGANGFNVFKPEEIVENQYSFDVLLSDFKLNNQSVKIGEKKNGHVLLHNAISRSTEISLKHNENVFSIEFSALNYFQPDRTRFRYMLEGFNDQWIETDARNRSATYTNLNPGTYLFRVKASASDGTWGDNETQLKITVIPPFYVTGWAFALYFISFVFLVLMLVFTIRRRAKIHYLREQEKDEYQRLRDLDSMKINFFTNVSHEFRTPLTLILTPLDKLLKEVKEAGMHEQLVMIKRNATRLLNMVNQLLDFRKLEVNNISLNTSYGDISGFLEDEFNSFVNLFESKNIRYHFQSNVKEYFVNFDKDKMEKIVFNLLSNAVKFTSENGNIEFNVLKNYPDSNKFNDLFSGREYLEIQVKDDGIGIHPDRKEKVFERFFQGENSSSIIKGSGIGLSLTKEFVEMHDGTINVISEPGKGSLFIVLLPLSTDIGTNASLNENFDSKPIKPYNDGVIDKELVADKNKKPVILIIEDNEDLRFYLKENLKHEYEILEAVNGSEGWRLTLSAMPQLVVTDIMIPFENGIDLCRRIKNESRTSHIPVILLTARISHEQNIEGLEAGADDYITKPFNYAILELKIKRLIEQRNIFQRSFAKKFEIKPGEIGITSMDEKFLKKGIQTVEKNIGNSEFTVEKMGRELGVSRGHLYNKLMALTGKTPIEFIRIMRLKRAAQLLAKSQQSVAEIAFQVGFNDPKYFTKYFKDEFGVVPSEFAKNHKHID